MLINKLDNVEVNIESGHKYAICDIKKGENIIKYGQPIGHAVCDIKKGEQVHTHNIKTNLSGKLEYSYNPTNLSFKKENIRSCEQFLGARTVTRPKQSILTDSVLRAERIILSG